MTLTNTGEWIPVTPNRGARSAIVQNPTGNSSIFITQRIGATGVDETDPADCPGIEIAADGNLSCDASSTIWIKGTDTETCNVCFFR